MIPQIGAHDLPSHHRHHYRDPEVTHPTATVVYLVEGAQREIKEADSEHGRPQDRKRREWAAGVGI